MDWKSSYCLFLNGVISISASAVSANDQIEYSEIEAQERLQIIKELTYRLDTKLTCNLNPSWDDVGSGADLDGYFFIPSVSQSEYIIGGLASQNNSSKNCVTTVSEAENNPYNIPRLLAPPVDWRMIWKDTGSGSKKDGSMWEAVPPSSDYRCLGSIPQLGYNKPNILNYRCVHSSLTEKVVTNSIAWSDIGSGADADATMFRLPNTGTFVTVPAKTRNTEAYDLNPNPFKTPEKNVANETLTQMALPQNLWVDK